MIPFGPQRPRTPRGLFSLVLLLASGPLLNLFPIEIPLVFFYFFGSIPAILALRLFGPAAGLACGILASLVLPIHVGHPLILIWAIGEICFLALIEKFWKNRNLIFNDALYWAFIGSPLIYASFILAGTDLQVALSLSAKNCVNGMTNAVFASMLLHLLPLERWFLHAPQQRPVALNHLLYSLMLGFLLVPGTIMLTAHVKNSLTQTERLIGETLKEKSYSLTHELTFLERVRSKNRSGEGKTRILENLKAHWNQEAASGNWQLTLIENDLIVLSTCENWKSGTIFAPLEETDMIWMREGFFHRIPRVEQYVPKAEKWRKSSFMMITPFEQVPGWSLVVEKPIGPFLPELRSSVTRLFVFMALLAYLALILAWVFGRRISVPIDRLSQVTKDLPSRAEKGEREIDWPTTQVLEIGDLVRNCRGMYDSLQEKFNVIRQSQQTLEQRVLERTSELAETNSALQKSEKRYQVLTESSPVGIFHMDFEGSIHYINPQCCETLGITPAEGLGSGWTRFVHPKDLRELLMKWRDAVREKIPFQMEYRFQRNDGNIVWVLAQATPQDEADGENAGYIGTLTDISDRVAAEKRLRENQNRLNQLAYHDILTDLPNRLLFQDRLEHALAKARRSGQRIALLFLDLDRFKKINDSLGHEWGDNLLCEVAARLRSCVRDSDTVARLGGDEFMVILERIDNLKQVASVAQKILNLLSSPIEMEGYSLYATASIGISLFPNDGNSVEGLMKCSDSAMYRAKELGRNNYQFYTSDMNARAHELLLLESGLRQALERDQFILHYQPQYELNGNRLVGFEALIRWQHPDHGMISPGDFIPLAEETGLIVPIGEWVLRTACAQNREWQQQGLPPVRMAVNISARQFRQSGLIQTVSRVLEQTGLDARWLELELTESMIMGNTESSTQTMRSLKKMGVELAIDDFGSGYSSLAYLKRFPISKLKIDQSFVRDILIDANDAVIASSVIALAKSMNLEVIAEGVEDNQQLEFLRQKGCHHGQGYLFSRPLPAEQAVFLFENELNVAGRA